MLNLHSLRVSAVTSLLAVAVGLVTQSSTQAAQFSFSYARDGIQASGIITTSDLDPTTNTYTITGITGQRNGAAIKGLIPKTTSGVDYSYHYFPHPYAAPYVYYNNILYNNETLFDQGGMLFKVESLATPINVFFDPTVGRFIDLAYTGILKWNGTRYSYFERSPIEFQMERLDVVAPLPVVDVPNSSAVPEPSEIVGTVLAGGLVLGFGWARRRRLKPLETEAMPSVSN